MSEETSDGGEWNSKNMTMVLLYMMRDVYFNVSFRDIVGFCMCNLRRWRQVTHRIWWQGQRCDISRWDWPDHFHSKALQIRTLNFKCVNMQGRTYSLQWNCDSDSSSKEQSIWNLMGSSGRKVKDSDQVYLKKCRNQGTSIMWMLVPMNL